MTLSGQTKPAVTGLVLAGGLGRRFGGADKGLVAFRGRPLIAHVIERLGPQVDELLVNANRNLDSYRGFGPRVVDDGNVDFAGPLAGIRSGVAAASHPFVATVPCDAPLLPDELVSRLLTALQAHEADVAVAAAGGHRQPVFAVYRREVLPSLAAFLATDGRKVGAWHQTLRAVEVPFEDASAFVNLNTPEDLALAERQA